LDILVGLLGRGISPSPGLCSQGTVQHRRILNTSMPRAGFEPMIPLFEWSKTIRALDDAATGTNRAMFYTV